MQTANAIYMHYTSFNVKCMLNCLFTVTIIDEGQLSMQPLSKSMQLSIHLAPPSITGTVTQVFYIEKVLKQLSLLFSELKNGTKRIIAILFL